MNSILIGNRYVGEDFPPLVIAEIGINHEGSLKIAKQMVDAAVKAGAEVIKHQTHVVEDEMAEAAKSVIPGNADVSIYEIMKRCALSEDDETELKRYVESKGCIFISTPFSRAAADRLERMNVVAYKIGSGECNNYPLIKHIAKFRKPVILSTGMNSISDIQISVNILEEHKVPYALLHCTNLYPTKPEYERLGAMLELKKKFNNAVIGLSDHSLNNNACLAATALGACILERHFTDSKYRPGPDICCSMDPVELQTLIQGSKEIFLMRGGEKKPLKEEEVTINFAFASVVAIKDIKSGEEFSMENIWVKRPGTGEIKAIDFESLIGKKSAKDIKSGTLLTWKDIQK